MKSQFFAGRTFPLIVSVVSLALAACGGGGDTQGLGGGGAGGTSNPDVSSSTGLPNAGGSGTGGGFATVGSTSSVGPGSTASSGGTGGSSSSVGSGGAGGASSSISSTNASSSASSSSVSSSSVSSSSVSSSSGGNNCIEVALGAFTLGTADGTVGFYTAVPTPDQGDATDIDSFQIEFYGSAFDPNLDGEATGTFDLSAAGDDNYSTCARCLRLFVDPTAPGKQFFQQSGALTLDATSDQVNGTVSGTLTDTTLIEVTIDTSTFVSTPVVGGACLHIASAPVSVTGPVVPPGWTCNADFYGDGDCDCGCGALDIDCPDANVASCDFCDDLGSCSTDTCPGTINPTNSAVCQ